MSQRTALITGATGLLGREVLEAFQMTGWKATGTGYSRADGVDILKVDLNDESQVTKILDEVKPQVIVHCAAQRFPDKVDKDPEAARSLNVQTPSILSRLASSQDISLIYISTDYVFPGKPGDAPYAATSVPSPTNLYGQTKLDGENAVLESFKSAGKQGAGVVLRVPVLYGHAETPSESATNVLMDAVWRAQTQGEKIKMDHWAIRYPTNTEDVARVCQDIAVKYTSTADKSTLPTILQFSSEDKMTKYEICQSFGQIMGLPIDNIEANTEGNDPNASVQRPYDCHLSTEELKGLGIDTKTVNFVDWWRREVKAFKK